MASLMFASCLTCLLVWNKALGTDLKPSIRQEGGLILADVGDTVTLRCFYESNTQAMFLWYKQTLGQKPNLISTFFQSDEAGTFRGDFKNNLRLSLETKNGIYHLTISDFCISDSATYFCTSSYSYTFEFGDGVTVSVKGSGSIVPALVHQSVSGSIQPGGSVTLNCIVQTGTCDGQHSVYWFKDSGDAQPGIIYTHGDRTDQCERKPDIQTHTCVYNVEIKQVDRSHAGTYYCAVASCGHILFGNGTKLDLRSDADSLVLVYFLGGALALTTTLTVLLTLLLYRLHKANSCKCTDSQAPSTVNAEGDQVADNLHYAALRKQRFKGTRNPTNEADCVYSTVKL